MKTRRRLLELGIHYLKDVDTQVGGAVTVEAQTEMEQEPVQPAEPVQSASTEPQLI